MYTITFYKGTYQERQEQANRDNCDVYIEHHFNTSDHAGTNYSVVILASNCSSSSKALAKDYIARVCTEFNTKAGGDKGLMILPPGGHGNLNLQFTKMPAILLEPLFGSNPEQAKLIKSPQGQDRLAKILIETIKSHFPNGAKIAFSVGHKYKPNSNDRGAKIHGGGYEAEYAEIVLQKCQELIKGTSQSSGTQVAARVLKIVVDGKVVDEIPLQGNSIVTFDEDDHVVTVKTA